MLAREQESGHWVILHVYTSPYISIYSHRVLILMNLSLPMHTEVAGSGVQVPFGDIPSDVHTAIIFPVGTNPVLHLKNISAPPSVFGTVTMEPLSGAAGIPQLTERKNSGNRNILKTIAHIRCCTLFRRENVVLVVQYHVISTHAGY